MVAEPEISAPLIPKPATGHEPQPKDSPRSEAVLNVT